MTAARYIDRKLLNQIDEIMDIKKVIGQEFEVYWNIYDKHCAEFPCPLSNQKI